MMSNVAPMDTTPSYQKGQAAAKNLTRDNLLVSQHTKAHMLHQQQLIPTLCLLDGHGTNVWIILMQKSTNHNFFF